MGTEPERAIFGMGMVEDDGVDRSDERRTQRRKKAAVGVAGLCAILAGGAYAVTALRAAQDTAATDPAPHAPAVQEPPWTAPTGPTRSSAVPTPTRGPASPRLSAVRRSSRPSPVPSPSRMPDDEVAAAQIARLVQAPYRQPASPASPATPATPATPGDPGAPAGVASADTASGATVVVTNEIGADGSAIRVLSARYDLTARGTLLWAADTGEVVGDARCTRRLRIPGGAGAESRPGLLLCWRVSPARSVVTIATRRAGGPVAAASARIIDRTWQTLG